MFLLITKRLWLNLVHLWKYFKIAELHEVKRQRGDSKLINLLNKVRVASLVRTDMRFIKIIHCISKTDANYPTNALHIFEENVPCHLHNQNMLN